MMMSQVSTQPQQPQQIHDDSVHQPESANRSGSKKLSKTKSNKKGSSRAPTLFCHDADFKTVITVPVAAVHHLPAALAESSRRVRCRKYDAANPAESCPDGEACKFVHLDASHPQTQIQAIHVNYAYRSLEEVPHKRLPESDEMLSVTAPNNRAPIQMIQPQLILMTKGVAHRKRSGRRLSHCAHYYFNHYCDRGEKCCFVHTVHLDEKKRGGGANGRGQRHHDLSQQQEAQSNNANTLLSVSVQLPLARTSFIPRGGPKHQQQREQGVRTELTLQQVEAGEAQYLPLQQQLQPHQTHYGSSSSNSVSNGGGGAGATPEEESTTTTNTNTTLGSPLLLLSPSSCLEHCSTHQTYRYHNDRSDDDDYRNVAHDDDHNHRTNNAVAVVIVNNGNSPSHPAPAATAAAATAAPAAATSATVTRRTKSGYQRNPYSLTNVTTSVMM